MADACMDCHSNVTKWPWYSNVAPVSWLVAKGRRRGSPRAQPLDPRGRGRGDDRVDPRGIDAALAVQADALRRTIVRTGEARPIRGLEATFGAGGAGSGENEEGGGRVIRSAVRGVAGAAAGSTTRLKPAGFLSPPSAFVRMRRLLGGARLRVCPRGYSRSWLCSALSGGLVLHVLGVDAPAHLAWAATTALLLVPLTISVTRTLLRGDVGVDAIALVSMAGALALGEYLAGAVIALMLAGGNALEEVANRRARRELSALVERAPRVALVRRDDSLEEVPVDDVVDRRRGARARRRGRAGRRPRRQRGGGRRRVGADRRAAAGHGASGRSGA